MPMKKPWTVVSGATAVVAIGAAGFIFGSGGDDSALRGPISLRDGAPVAAEEASNQSPDGFELIPNPVINVAHTNDSPDGAPGPAPAPVDSPDDSPFQAPAPASADSPDDSPFQAPAPASADSPDDSPFQAPAPAPDDSPDDSPDDGSVDSPDGSD